MKHLAKALADIRPELWERLLTDEENLTKGRAAYLKAVEEAKARQIFPATEAEGLHRQLARLELEIRFTAEVLSHSLRSALAAQEKLEASRVAERSSRRSLKEPA